MLGAPGSGKGTQADFLAVSLGVPAISTGAMLRDAVALGSALGGKVESIMASGALVDDGLMAEVVRERLSRPDAAGGFLLDGYPRTTGQAETLDRILEALGVQLDAVVLLEVPETVLVQRAVARRRADDREEVVRERLRVYREKTEPLVAHYSQRGLLRRIDGERSMPAVTAAILQELGVQA
ncbi:MAG: adenylate kinase [Thermoanaerobaculia bacterium]|nr:adenylate kinase [Thermoanaerobaculia bacterium]MBP9824750.1 adenylate kinase [Thermoanaerobaculia bacterium]